MVGRASPTRSHGAVWKARRVFTQAGVVKSGMATKRCSKCRIEKPLEDFARRGSSGRQAYCRKCNAKQRAEWLANNKERHRLNGRRWRTKTCEELRALKNVPCADCGNRYPHYVMDFDHQEDKKFQLGDAIGRYSVARIREEVAKCEVVCSNCHRIRTHDPDQELQTRSVRLTGEAARPSIWRMSVQIRHGLRGAAAIADSSSQTLRRVVGLAALQGSDGRLEARLVVTQVP